ncbi:hypothetical protein B0T17DRAFT_101574 [Bombardia bombarda]|uniref:Zn(2)-C6 fungal-type domain-containing protein n=1 Tax=Bombardia bombarda TaxID=252184 RepID=A0AA40CH01_9PEZI|nr:hypothetical protein B0T17DRAFT_101574 [Bombardia bombarda]
MRSFRELRPARGNNEHDSSNAPGPLLGLGLAKKSRQTRKTQMACEACRRRKTRCNGRRPACSTCKVSNRDCEYASEPGVSRTELLKRKNDELQTRVALFTELFDLLSSLPEPELRASLSRIRSADRLTDIEQLVRFIQYGNTLQLSQANANTAVQDLALAAPAISPADSPRDSSLPAPLAARSTSLILILCRESPLFDP